MAAKQRAAGAPVAVSIGAHAVLLAVILWRLGTPPVYSEPPVMNVELTPWPRATPDPPPRPKAKSRLEPAAPAQRLHEAAPLEPLPAPPPVILPSGKGDGAATALRRALGCQHVELMGLSRAERQDCQDRLAAAGRAPSTGPTRLDLTGHGAFAPPAEPYLQRRPTHGCKPRAGGDVAPMGQIGAATGITCAWRF